MLQFKYSYFLSHQKAIRQKFDAKKFTFDRHSFSVFIIGSIPNHGCWKMTIFEFSKLINNFRKFSLVKIKKCLFAMERGEKENMMYCSQIWSEKLCVYYMIKYLDERSKKHTEWKFVNVPDIKNTV